VNREQAQPKGQRPSHYVELLRAAAQDVPIETAGVPDVSAPEDPQAHHSKLRAILTGFGVPIAGAAIAGLIGKKYGQGLEASAGFASGYTKAAEELGRQHRAEAAAAQDRRDRMMATYFPALGETAQNYILNQQGIPGQVEHKPTQFDRAALEAGFSVYAAGASSPDPSQYVPGLKSLARAVKSKELEGLATALESMAPDAQERARKQIEAVLSTSLDDFKKLGPTAAAARIHSLIGSQYLEPVLSSVLKQALDPTAAYAGETAKAELDRLREETNAARSLGAQRDAQAVYFKARTEHPERFGSSSVPTAGSASARRTARDEFYRMHPELEEMNLVTRRVERAPVPEELQPELWKLTNRERGAMGLPPLSLRDYLNDPELQYGDSQLDSWDDMPPRPGPR